MHEDQLETIEMNDCMYVQSRLAAEQENYPEPTTEERFTLRNVSDSIPYESWLLFLWNLPNVLHYMEHRPFSPTLWNFPSKRREKPI